MKTKKLLFTVFLVTYFFISSPVHALDLNTVFNPQNSIILKIQEGVEYFFAFSNESKIAVLDKQAEKRLDMAQDSANQKNDNQVENLVQDYLEIKDKQDNILEKSDNDQVLGMVKTRTIEQQKTMEQLKAKVNNEVKKQVVQVQERVVNQVAKRVVEVNGKEGQTEFLNKVEHVWAPGTGPGGEAGVVIEGDAMQFAPGTSDGGPSQPDIKTVEIKTGGNAEGEGGGNKSGSGNKRVD